MALHLLFKIVNPDYATLNQGPEYIRNYWDDVTHAITATYQATRQLTGRMGGQSQYRFCDGTTLNTFRLSPTYPYAVSILYANSQFCMVLDVCDAYIQNPLIITNATSGNSDGTVSIRGYTTKPFKIDGGITKLTEYSLDGTSWQTSPYFTGLSAGTHTAYMRDVSGCLDSRDFEIGTLPVYGVRFTTSYKDHLGSTTRIDVLKRYYDGLSEEVRASATPLVIKERADSMFTELRGQECTIGLLASGNEQYLELFTGDDREFKVEVYKNGSLFWTGWIVPDVYEESYLAPPFEIIVSATDGIGELKEVPFTEALPEGFMTQWDVIGHILKNTDAFLPIISSINLYEIRMDKRPEDDPLKQAVVSLDAYHDGAKTMDCASVLVGVLRSYGAFIRQYNGAWHLIRVEELATNYPRRYFDLQGNYLSYDIFFPNRLVTRPSTNPAAFFWIGNTQALAPKPAYKKSEVHIDYGLRDNLIKGGYFKTSDYTSAGDHKFLSGTGSGFQAISEPKSDVTPIIMGSVLTAADAVDYLATDRVYIKADPDMRIYFRVEYMITASKASINTTDIPPEFIFSIKLNDKHLNATVNSLNPASGSVWLANAHRFQSSTSDIHTWKTIEMKFTIPEDGWLTILLFQAAMNDYDFVNVQVRKIVVIPLRRVPPALAEDETFTSVNARKQFYTPETVEATHGDVIPHKNATAMYRNLILVNNGNDVSLDWQRRGKSEETPVLELLANTMLTLNETPVRVLRGILKGAFDWNQVIQEPEVLTRYMPIGFEYNDKEQTISAEFMELLGTTQPPQAKRLLLETGAELKFEDYTYIGLEG